MGFIVPNGDIDQLGDRVIEAAAKNWNRSAAVEYILAHHTWDRRARVYQEVILPDLRLPLRYRWFGL
jgi:glycosyltransferase involved in cell wall biosynthesis